MTVAAAADPQEQDKWRPVWDSVLAAETRQTSEQSYNLLTHIAELVRRCSTHEGELGYEF